MAVNTGTVTIMGGGQSTAITVTNDQYGLGLASSFSSLQAQFASTSGLYTYSTGSNFLAVTNTAGQVAVFGPSTSSILFAGDSTTLGYFGSGDATVVSGDGNDTISAGSGSDTIAAGTGNNVIMLGSGASGLVEATGNDSIQAGAGSDTVDVTGGTSSIYGGSGILTVNNVANATIYGGVAIAYVASGSDTTLISSTHNNVLVANQSSALGEGGSVTIDGSQASGGNQFWAGSGNASLIGGTGNDTLVGAQGNATLTGGAGSNDFDFFQNQGGSATNVTITDFGSSTGNLINLDGYGSSGFQYAIQNAKVSGGSTTISLNDGSKITLSGYTGQLSDSNVKYNG